MEVLKVDPDQVDVTKKATRTHRNLLAKVA